MIPYDPTVMSPAHLAGTVLRLMSALGDTPEESAAPTDEALAHLEYSFGEAGLVVGMLPREIIDEVAGREAIPDEEAEDAARKAEDAKIAEFLKAPELFKAARDARAERDQAHDALQEIRRADHIDRAHALVDAYFCDR